MMRQLQQQWWRALAFVLTLLAFGNAPLWAAGYPAPKEGGGVIQNFRFHTGEMLPELKLRYTTVGEPTGEPVLILHAINAADDERNPPELGIMERELKRVKNGSLYRIPGSPDTRGHGTTGQAKWWKQQLQSFLATEAERR